MNENEANMILNILVPTNQKLDPNVLGDESREQKRENASLKQVDAICRMRGERSHNIEDRHCRLELHALFQHSKTVRTTLQCQGE